MGKGNVSAGAIRGQFSLLAGSRARTFNPFDIDHLRELAAQVLG
jgi:hypothetical protein